ncbi:MAG: IPTL-CTERM sorting domain-containing protein, partial [Comamonas sp.]
QSGLAVDGLLVDGAPPSTLALNNPGTLPALTAPLYKGTVADPGSNTTVDLQITGPNGYTETLQSTIQADNSYSSQGAALQPGTYTVVATITGTTITQTQTFQVTAPPPTNKPAPVPTLNEWVLIGLSSLVAMFGIGRLRRRQH